MDNFILLELAENHLAGIPLACVSSAALPRDGGNTCGTLCVGVAYLADALPLRPIFRGAQLFYRATQSSHKDTIPILRHS